MKTNYVCNDDVRMHVRHKTVLDQGSLISLLIIVMHMSPYDVYNCDTNLSRSVSSG